jgi:hypothetical protein
MQEAPGEMLYESVLLWIDDILVYAKTESQLLDNLEEVFYRSDGRGIKLSAERCNFLAREVRWCGRVVSESGTRFDPDLIQELIEMEEHKNAGELQQFICAMGWLRSAIPAFTESIKLQQDIRTKAAKIAGSVRTRSISKVLLADIGWSEEHSRCFENVKRIVGKAVHLSHPNPENILCLFSDASQDHRSLVLTQVSETDLDKLEISDQEHEPLSFLSGTFKGASQQWSTIEKEAFPIIEALGRLRHFLLTDKGFVIFTDHRNLVYILDPAARKSERSYRALGIQANDLQV